MFIFSLAVCAFGAKAKDERIDMTESMKSSVAYLQISYYGYEQYQPWRNKSLVQGWAIGAAVGKNQLITPAWNVANAAFIRARIHGQNEFISAEIKYVDYENNIALIELTSSEMSRPLKPLKFSEKYIKGKELSFYWLSSGGHLYSGRGFLDRAEMNRSSISYAKCLNFIAGDISDNTSNGQIFCIDSEVIGIALASNDKEAGILPSEVINRFLKDIKDGKYSGFGLVGFATHTLLDPAMRDYLKMPKDLLHGVYVPDVYTIGTGSDCLKSGDVIIAVDGKSLNPYGRFMHKQYDRLFFDYLITSKQAGEKITFEIWRDGKQQTLTTKVKNFDVSQMLVPYYEVDTQPEYIVLGGFIIQKLTRTYMAARGEDWPGKVAPHIYNYLVKSAFKPTPQRRQIIILSYVLPADINLGYARLGQLVVDNINGIKIGSMADVAEALKLNPSARYDVIEFEMDNPKIVLDRQKIKQASAKIAANYGIEKIENINYSN